MNRLLNNNLLATKLCECGCQREVKFNNRFIRGHNQKGSRRITKIGDKKSDNGYIYIYQPDHPSSKKDGGVYEHKFVLETYLERILVLGEMAHHIDEIRNHNDIENLELCLKGKHIIYHHTGRKNSLETKQKMREKAIGRKHTIESRIKMSMTKLGKHRPELKGKIPWNKGRTNVYSPETIEKIRESAKKRRKCDKT